MKANCILNTFYRYNLCKNFAIKQCLPNYCKTWQYVLHRLHETEKLTVAWVISDFRPLM